MTKKLLLVSVFAAACLGLLATPVTADHFSDMQPGNTNVHPWGG